MWCALLIAAATPEARAQSASPTIASVELRAPVSGTAYTLGEPVIAVVTFSEAVTVSRTPQLALRVGGATKQAIRYGSTEGGVKQWFRYIVRAEDLDANGVGIDANSLSLAGGSIAATDDGAAAALAHAAVAEDAARQVRGNLVAAPAVTAVRFSRSSLPLSGDTFGPGEVIKAFVQFDRAVAVTGTPRLGLRIGSATRQAARYSVPADDPLTLWFRYVVRTADADADGIAVAADALSLNGGTIALLGSAATAAGLTHAAVAADASRKVDGSAAVAATIASVVFGGVAPGGGSYARREAIWAIVAFDRAVTVVGTPQLGLSVGSATRQADFYTIGSDPLILWFRYVVQSGDADPDGVSIAANALALNGGSINISDGSIAATLTHDAVPADATRKVDATTAILPGVTGIELTAPIDGSTYTLGEPVVAIVTFSEAVEVTGTPRLALTIGGAGRNADWYGFTEGGAKQWFRYVVQAGDTDSDGVSVAADALDLNGGTIAADSDGEAAALTHAAVAADASRKVDGARTDAPSVTGVAFSGSPLSGDAYGLGEEIWVRVAFDRMVIGSGVPRLTLTVGSTPREARCSPSQITARLQMFCVYAVRAADADSDGVSIAANALSSRRSYLRLAGADVAATLTHAAVAADASRKVNGGSSAAPSVRLVGFITGPRTGDTFGLGEVIWAYVAFDRSVAFSGKPQLGLRIGSATRQASYTHSADLHFFRYVVQAGDTDSDGIAVAANALSLNGGTITLAGGSTAASLTHDAVAADASRKVDGSASAAPWVFAFGSLHAPADGKSYGRGETIWAYASFSHAVDVTGTPRLALTIGSAARQAEYAESGPSGRLLVFRYVVQSGDADGDGYSIAADSLSLNGGTIVLAGSSTAAGLTHAAVAADPARKVDGGTAVAAIAADSGGAPVAGEFVVAGLRDRTARAPAEPEASGATCDGVASVRQRRAWRWEISDDGSTGWTDVTSRNGSACTYVFVPAAADAGKFLRAYAPIDAVTSNAYESAPRAYTPVTSAVLASPSAAAGSAAWTAGADSPREGEAMAAGPLPDGKTARGVWRWERCDGPDDATNACTPLAPRGSDSWRYTPAAADAGSYLRAFVYYTSGGGTRTRAATSLAGPVAAAVGPTGQRGGGPR